MQSRGQRCRQLHLTVREYESCAFSVGINVRFACVRLYNYIVKNFDLSIIGTTFLSDSQIKLCWISKDPTSWKAFVRNHTRKSDVTDKTRWGFCPGKEIQADLLPQSLLAHRLSRLQLWWHGTRWLASTSDLWPEFAERIDVEDGSLDEIDTPPHVNAYVVNTRPSVLPLIDCDCSAVSEIFYM